MVHLIRGKGESESVRREKRGCKIKRDGEKRV